MTNLTTTDYRLNNALNLIDTVDKDNWYFFTANYIPQSNATLQPLYDIPANTLSNLWNNMIQGVSLSNANFSLVIDNNIWTSNTIFTMYDDSNISLPHSITSGNVLIIMQIQCQL